MVRLIRSPTVVALHVVLAMAFLGALFVQVVLLSVDLKEFLGPDVVDVRVRLAVITILGFVTVQVTVVCIWRLLTMVRRDTVFSHNAFRYVDVMFGAVVAAALLTLAFAGTLAPGIAIAPGMVLLICGAAVVVAGIALIILVLRRLLAQAVARDTEAHRLRAELDTVI